MLLLLLGWFLLGGDCDFGDCAAFDVLDFEVFGVKHWGVLETCKLYHERWTKKSPCRSKGRHISEEILGAGCATRKASNIDVHNQVHKWNQAWVAVCKAPVLWLTKLLVGRTVIDRCP